MQRNGVCPRCIKQLYKVGIKRSEVKSQEVKSQARETCYLFCDEFTNYNDTEIGIKAIQLLEKLGYEVIIPEHIESGRAGCRKD